MSQISDNFCRDGFAILREHELQAAAANLRSYFEQTFKSKFGNDATTNRNLIKRFAGTSQASLFYSHDACMSFVLDLGLSEPVFCGPIVSHYTARDMTGGGYGLPLHQDFPSMASSKNAIILWMSLTDASEATHGLQVVPGAHKNGALPGDQLEGGYVLNDQGEDGAVVLNVKAGDIVAMSSWLPHRTYLNAGYHGWKLSLSQRFDDLNEASWAERGFSNAYGTSVDRDLYARYFESNK